MRNSVTGLALLGAIALAGCQDNTSPPAESITPPSLATRRALTGTPTERAAQLAERINGRLAARGSKYRLVGASFFTVGLGVPPFRSHVFGRWGKRDLTYLIDASDFPSGPAPAAVDAALVNAYETWDAVPGVNLSLTRVPDTQANPDVLDAIVTDNQGNCVDIVDVTSPAVTAYDPANGIFDLSPFADIVHGGWLGPDYFEKCLGSADIIAVTWTFGGGDANHDQFQDILYNEQYANTHWGFVTSGSVFLDFDGPFDIQSIFVHEDGHALGLGHTGGPNANQPLRLRRTGQVFTPEAVMNPFSLGGEKRRLFPLDLASLGQLYRRVN